MKASKRQNERKPMTFEVKLALICDVIEAIASVIVMIHELMN